MSFGRSILGLVAGAGLAGGCASASNVAAPPTIALPEDKGGEQGLANLRVALGFYPVEGYVQRGADGDWLVNSASGARLVAAPAPAGECIEGGDYGGMSIAFEGAPGAVLRFDAEVVKLIQFDKTQGCAVATDVFPARDLPDPTPLLAIVPTAPKAKLEAHIDIPGMAGGATVKLSAAGVEVRAASGESLYKNDFPPGEHCTFAASVAYLSVGELGLMRVSRSDTSLIPGEASCKELQADEWSWSNAEGTANTWIELDREGHARVVAADETPRIDGGGRASIMHVVDLPDGELTFDSVGTVNGGREGNYWAYDWSWNLKPHTGAALTLASGPDYSRRIP